MVSFSTTLTGVSVWIQNLERPDSQGVSVYSRQAVDTPVHRRG
jgi:hypothetical protein